METALPLDRMTVEEKLRTIERIWEDLCRNPESVPSPQWHRDVLEARETRLKAGQDHFADWEEAKRKLRGPAK